ncbi:MAG: helix-turn-helix domain-containing protein, partial [Phenylobacterium sp.]|nr:helix-turn-helix domain-containing protein [Phenylobacterium sp.]
MPRVLTESDVADFRDRLCEVAEQLFAERGPEAVTMRQLASALGVSPMTPYRYFK